MNEIGQYSYYLENLDINPNQDVLVLSTHYYYDLSEINNIKVLVHSKMLNQVSNLPKLMSEMMKGLSNGTKLVGSFIDNKIYYRSKTAYWLFNLFSSENRNYISRKKVIKLFEKHGLKIVDITELNGVTYFCVKRY